MAEEIRKTPQLDELEKGEWPSFVKEIKKEAEKSPMANDLLGQLERSPRGNEGVQRRASPLPGRRILSYPDSLGSGT